ncbi:MAG: c-type cytochrome [Saprospiraceae bacterium]
MKFNFTQRISLSALLLAALAWQGCKGDDDPTGPACNIPNADLSYTLNIKAIIDQQCISCHVAGSGVPGVVGDYSTYEGIKSRLDNGKVLDRVVVKKDMPQGGGMSQAQRDSINCWIAAGYPK